MTQTEEMMHPADGGGWRRLPNGDMINHICDNPHHRHPFKHELRHLFIYMNQIMYDVEAQVSMTMVSHRAETGVETNTQSDMVEKYRGQFVRWINKHFEKVKEQLILAVVDTRSTAKGDNLKEWSEKELVLQFPDWWDDTAWQPLVDVVHSYIVNAVLSEYYKVTLSTRETITISKMEDAFDDYEKIKVLLCKHKVGDIKRPLRPMGF